MLKEDIRSKCWRNLKLYCKINRERIYSRTKSTLKKRSFFFKKEQLRPGIVADSLLDVIPLDRAGLKIDLENSAA